MDAQAQPLPPVPTTLPLPAVAPEVLEQVAVSGDLSGLTAAQRLAYYQAVCRSLGLNPLTKPFEYLTLNGKLRLYALRDCADQLRRLHGISIYITSRERMSDLYIVTARAKDRTGREDESTGAVALGTLKGDALANALMKCETKAKRRVTLSLAGLGWLDETELTTIPGVSVGEPTGDQQSNSENQGLTAQHPEKHGENPHVSGVLEATGQAPPPPLTAAPLPTRIPVGLRLPCAEALIVDLRPAQLSLLIGKVGLKALADKTLEPLHVALLAERATRLQAGRRPKLGTGDRDGQKVVAKKPEV